MAPFYPTLSIIHRQNEEEPAVIVGIKTGII
jgi:hypothetical protein